MREILFRGQTRRKGQKVWMDGTPVDSNWVEGYGVCMGTGDFSVIYAGHPVEKFTVYTDTVGQYTGLTDKNGKKIFEGDVLHEPDVVQNGEIQIKGEFFEVAMRKGVWCVLTKDDWDFLNSCVQRCEVVGNIHDNPDLLEVSDNG